jgi:hypothetical protein
VASHPRSSAHPALEQVDKVYEMLGVRGEGLPCSAPSVLSFVVFVPLSLPRRRVSVTDPGSIITEMDSILCFLPFLPVLQDPFLPFCLRLVVSSATCPL